MKHRKYIKKITQLKNRTRNASPWPGGLLLRASTLKSASKHTPRQLLAARVMSRICSLEFELHALHTYFCPGWAGSSWVGGLSKPFFLNPSLRILRITEWKARESPHHVFGLLHFICFSSLPCPFPSVHPELCRMLLNSKILQSVRIFKQFLKSLKCGF